MTKERALELAEALTVDIDDEESEEGLGVHYYPDGEYNGIVTVEIADALRELAELKEKYGC